MARAWLKDQLARDKEYSGTVIYSPEDDEPKINAWLEVQGVNDKLIYMFVDGAFIRRKVSNGYVEGGHFYRYGWIPEDQIWLEDIMSVVDQFCTGIHETHERYRMKWLGWNYEKAHASASAIEQEVRLLLARKGTIIPMVEDIAKIFEMEAQGEDSLPAIEKFLKAEAKKAKEAEYQSNHSVGKQEFDGLKEN